MVNPIPKIGELNERIQILQRVDSPDEAGGYSTLYVSIGTFWAQVNQSRARTQTGEDSRLNTRQIEVILRFRDDFSSGDRLVYRGDSYDIISVNDLTGRRAFISVRASKSEAEGGR